MLTVWPNIVLIASFIYCTANALIIGFLINKHLDIKQWWFFTKDAFFKSAISVLAGLTAQGLFILFNHRLTFGIMRHIISSSYLMQCCQGTTTSIIMLQAPLVVLLAVATLKILLQHHLYANSSLHLDNESLWSIIILSNLISTGLLYGTTLFFTHL